MNQQGVEGLPSLINSRNRMFVIIKGTGKEFEQVVVRKLRIVLLIGIALFLLIGSGCNGEEKGAPAASEAGTVTKGKEEAGPVFKSIPGAEAMIILQSNPDTAFLDVRTPPERRQMHIKGSTLVPVGDVIRGRLPLSKEQPVMLICAVGGRSYVAGKVLSKMGYREVYNLDGGIEAWRRAGLPLEFGPEKVNKEGR